MRSSILQNIFSAVLVTVLFFAVTNKVYHLPFSFGDDHRLLAMLHPEKASNDYKAAFSGYAPDLTGTLTIDLHCGRFRPLSWSYDKLLCLLCGDTVYLFRLSNLVVLFFSSFFLLCIFTCFNVNRLSAVLLLGIYVFGKNNEVWWTLGAAPQNIGELLLLAGIYCWLLCRQKGATGFYVLPAVLFLFAGLAKESFFFCVPLLLLTDYFFFNPSPCLFAKEYLLSLLASVLPFLCLLAAVIYSKSVFAYPYPDSVLSIFAHNMFQFMYSAVFCIAPMAVLAIGSKIIQKGVLIKVVVLFAVWTIIQLVLLKGIKIEGQHHYLIPWLIYPLIITALAFRQLRNTSRKGYAAMVAVYGMVLLLFIKNTNVNVCAYSASLQAYYSMMDTIKKDTASSALVFLSGDASEKDWIKGTRAIMDNTGINKELYFATIATSIPSWEKDWSQQSSQHAFKHLTPDSVFYPDGRWIILVDRPAKNGVIDDSILFYKKNDSCFVKINGIEKHIFGKYHYFSVSCRGLSIKEVLRGNFNMENNTGFYAVKM